MIPPSVPGATFSIRVPPKRIYTLDEYVQNGIMTMANAVGFRMKTRKASRAGWPTRP
jgi:Flp pilus assembly CpaF family ATPase